MKISRDAPLFLRRNETAWNWIERRLFMRERNERSFNGHMFHEDILLGFTQMEHRGSAPFNIDSTNSELAEQLMKNAANNLSSTQKEYLVEQINEIAESFLTRGRALFWIMRDEDGRPSGSINISNMCVFPIFGQAIQYSPPGFEPHDHFTEASMPRQIRVLDKRQLLILKMPRKIWRKLKRQDRILRALDRYDLGVPLKFQPRVTHENPNATTNFDFAKWRKLQDFTFYKATRETGWNGRGYNSDNRSDFFDCVRLLRFRRTQLLLLDEIVRQLSSELSRVGREFYPEFNVKISFSKDTQTIEQLNQIEAQLEGEEVSFSDVINFCFNRV